MTQPLHRRLLACLFASSALAVVALSLTNSVAQAQDKPTNRLFEMRTYITEEGRLDALNKRFREHTNKLFVKHGMTLVGYWTPADANCYSDSIAQPKGSSMRSPRLIQIIAAVSLGLMGVQAQAQLLQLQGAAREVGDAGVHRFVQRTEQIDVVAAGDAVLHAFTR